MRVLALGCSVQCKLLTGDGQMRSMREGLYGEEFVEEYKVLMPCPGSYSVVYNESKQ